MAKSWRHCFIYLFIYYVIFTKEYPISAHMTAALTSWQTDGLLHNNIRIIRECEEFGPIDFP